ncbi:unannotated protein [freshwater metagenome]|uniref:Unannotated protein n=1 Tax=freshwater metagenome TaxID=449393 RepID=A0A6J6R695_9ZZZZ
MVRAEAAYARLLTVTLAVTSDPAVVVSSTAVAPAVVESVYCAPGTQSKMMNVYERRADMAPESTGGTPSFSTEPLTVADVVV